VLCVPVMPGSGGPNRLELVVVERRSRELNSCCKHQTVRACVCLLARERCHVCWRVRTFVCNRAMCARANEGGSEREMVSPKGKARAMRLAVIAWWSAVLMYAVRSVCRARVPIELSEGRAVLQMALSFSGTNLELAMARTSIPSLADLRPSPDDRRAAGMSARAPRWVLAWMQPCCALEASHTIDQSERARSREPAQPGLRVRRRPCGSRMR
jgi:hypothetical protein